MATGPNLIDPKYAPGAEQARQDVMVGVSTAMTLIGGQYLPSLYAGRYAYILSHVRRASRLHSRLHR
jgi:hypothetical protein